MELRHLRYFVAVAEELSFRRAAERLFLSQPALSKQIKDLEAEVGSDLLDRNTGGVRLTDAGTVFLDEVRDLLERAGLALRAAREAAIGRAGRIIVGNFGALIGTFLPGALAAFRIRYPQVEVNLREMKFHEQLAALRSRAIHVGFTMDVGEPIDPEFEWHEVLAGRASVAMGRQHPLARQKAVSLADLVEEQFIGIGETELDDQHFKRLHRVFALRKLRHRPFRRVNSTESLLALVGGNHGLSILLPEMRGAENILFKRIKEDGEDLLVRILVVWREEHGSRLTSNFVSTLLEQRKPAAAGVAGLPQARRRRN